jgi:hypothetical protein
MNIRAIYVQTTCFLEQSPAINLPRRALAEGVGTPFLVIAAAGSGQVFQHLMLASPALTCSLARCVYRARSISARLVNQTFLNEPYRNHLRIRRMSSISEIQGFAASDPAL